jgi:hypothetical protein
MDRAYGWFNESWRGRMLHLLHQDVVSAVSDEIASPRFRKEDSDSGACNIYSTHVMGKFECNNNACFDSS